jgi:uncharacterized glyoxalase superfamily protein PhnB
VSAAIPTAAIRQLWPLLSVQDIERSVEFYRDVLGFALCEQATAKGKMFWCRLERGGASLMLEQPPAGEGCLSGRRGVGITFYFVCDDADLMYAELAARGLKLDPPQVAYYGMKQLFVPEPDGYSICFESPTSQR